MFDSSIPKPKVLYTTLESGSKLIRFDNLSDIFWYDIPANNPDGIALKRDIQHGGDISYYLSNHREYFRDRNILTAHKQKIINIAMKDMSVDKDFLELVYKAKSSKREFTLNRFEGNLSMPHYASNSEKIFKRGRPGAKKLTLNLAFQVGTFVGGDYTKSFVKILKTILMCQAMNINVNIDMFDSDTYAIGNGMGYVICNVAKSSEKLNLKNILACSHREFFSTTLFNGYSASGIQRSIGTFLPEKRLIEDLSSRYDIIGGNTLRIPGDNEEQREMVSRILKIGLG
jgi:hypothetical protein